MSELFVPAGPLSRKVKCRVCGRSGYNTNGYGWQESCVRGHASCPECGHINTIAKAGGPRYCRGRAALNRHRRIGLRGR